ncbi:RadC family protein [Alysiella filiformis]|uniref:DNA repair protein RadC n=1 Tax=Alysiella filiformis DSM 16848 TaxID=1120981 RepID=A0A286EH83_9NEIS|nr:DNA repair protein RadC [Alysiella filiformis]QMT32362.1 DNA repair protein RadC [Alysiella filiformis]UBQ56718.1 DNA repair protein RadC [Alysiella filiformis DSM 16848]SOD70179.1 DNA repair protein RadC [Alysiella filiformis DSM 16848]
MSIKHWAEDERPREKLLEHGVATLSDAELLAILLRVGTRGKNAVELARDLLRYFGSLSAVMHATPDELYQHKGMGEASFAQFATVLEIGRRVLHEALRDKPILSSPQQVGDYLRLRIGREKVEVALVLLLNQQNQLMSCEELSRGTVAHNTVYIREVLKLALQHHASAIVFAHNHPSGSLEPSAEDLVLTQRLQSALHLLDIQLLDHFIITAHGWVSFQQRAWLAPIQAA